MWASLGMPWAPWARRESQKSQKKGPLKRIKGTYSQERLSEEFLSGIIDGCRQSSLYAIIQVDADVIQIGLIPYGTNKAIEYVLRVYKIDPETIGVSAINMAYDDVEYETRFSSQILHPHEWWEDVGDYPYETGKWLPGFLHSWSKAKRAMLRLGGKETIGYSGEQARRMLKALDGIIDGCRHLGCQGIVQFATEGVTVALELYEEEQGIRELIQIRPKINDSQAIEFWVNEFDSGEKEYLWFYRDWGITDYKTGRGLVRELLALNIPQTRLESRERVFGIMHKEWTQSTPKVYCPNTGEIMALGTIGPMGRFEVGSYTQYIIECMDLAYNHRKVGNHYVYGEVVSKLMESEYRPNDRVITWAVDCSCVVPYGYYPFSKLNFYNKYGEECKHTLQSGIKAGCVFRSCGRNYIEARPEYQPLPEEKKIRMVDWGD